MKKKITILQVTTMIKQINHALLAKLLSKHKHIFAVIN